LLFEVRDRRTSSQRDQPPQGDADVGQMYN
jgi:hypothetical protein